jgi:hypothetical protein
MKSEKRQGVSAGAYRERVAARDASSLPLLGRFLQAMLLDIFKKPAKVKALEKLHLTVGIDPGRPGDSLTVAFRNGRAIIESGIVRPDIVLMCEPAVLMRLSRMPAGPAALKFLRRHEGKDLVSRVLSGELKIRGLARHPLGMMKFAKLLAP